MKSALRVLLHLPLVMGLGIGLAFSNARAVLEALLGVKSEFVRTPKYRVEDTTDATWKRKKYKRKRGLLPLLELSFAFYFLMAILYSIKLHMWGTIPFLTLLFLRLRLHGFNEPIANCKWQETGGVLATRKEQLGFPDFQDL